MKPWQARVLIERTELEHRLTNLSQFLSHSGNRATLTHEDLHAMRLQEHYMQQYLNTLNSRISRFTND